MRRRESRGGERPTAAAGGGLLLLRCMMRAAGRFSPLRLREEGGLNLSDEEFRCTSVRRYTSYIDGLLAGGNILMYAG